MEVEGAGSKKDRSAATYNNVPGGKMDKNNTEEEGVAIGKNSVEGTVQQDLIRVLDTEKHTGSTRMTNTRFYKEVVGGEKQQGVVKPLKPILVPRREEM